MRLGSGPLLQQELRKVPQLTDVNSDQQNRGMQVMVTYDRATAARFGISSQLIDNTLYDAFGQRPPAATGVAKGAATHRCQQRSTKSRNAGHGHVRSRDCRALRHLLAVDRQHPLRCVWAAAPCCNRSCERCRNSPMSTAINKIAE